VRRTCDHPPATITTGASLRPRAVHFALFACVLFGTGACSSDNLRADLVPGTERIKPNNDGPWFTISPDERWIAYMEVDSADWDAGPNDPPVRFHLVALDVGTQSKTHHHIEDVPADVFPEGFSDPWRAVQNDLEASNWVEGRLFVHVKLTPWWIVFIPGVPAGRRVNPTTEGTCLDCPPASEWRRLIESYGMGSYSKALHSACTNGKLSDVIYFEARAGRGVAAIDRKGPDGESQRLLVLKRRFKNSYIGEIRVSPDERYVAYTLSTNLRSAIPLPTWSGEVHVLDLRTGADRRVRGSVLNSGNLMWSADSHRLYYAVVDGRVADGHGDGVYCISFPRAH
jgi:hypothetical protein